MKTARYLLMALMLTMSSWMARADETVTVSSTGSDISENLDLRAVATLFGEVSNLEEFEQQLNSEDRHISNLDLNGDGIVDYLRVVEIESNGSHLIIIQAVLAKDIYQDVASILVEKDAATAQVSVQIVGDAWLYGENYIIEPVYIYRPVIYDWFWASAWVCWVSPWYWDYWPGYWHYGWAPWAYHTYCHHIHVYHHEHPRCTYHYGHTPRPQGEQLRHVAATGGASRRDMASGRPERSFSARNTGMTNARQITSNRTTAARASSARTTSATPAARTSSNTFGSSYQRSVPAQGTTRSTGTTTATRGTTATTSTRGTTATTATTSTRSTSTSASRTPAATGTRTTTSTSSSRTVTSSTPARSYTPSQSTTTRSTTSTTTRSTTSTSTSRSTSTYSPSRTTSSPSSTRSTGSYGGGSAPRGGGGGGGGSRGGGGPVRR